VLPFPVVSRRALYRGVLSVLVSGVLLLTGCSGGSSSSPSFSPLSEMVPQSWSQVSGGYSHTIAVHVDGSLWGWGGNYFGQLGQGNSGYGTEQYSPILIDPGPGWTTSASGSYSTLAMKNGTLWSCGFNYAGQLGLGTTSPGFQLKQVGSDPTWSAISLSTSHVLALKSNGTLWSWGAISCACSSPGRDFLDLGRQYDRPTWGRHIRYPDRPCTGWGWIHLVTGRIRKKQFLRLEIGRFALELGLQCFR
jgi:hypothetical protein